MKETPIPPITVIGLRSIKFDAAGGLHLTSDMLIVNGFITPVVGSESRNPPLIAAARPFLVL